MPTHPWRNIVVRSLGGDLDPDSVVPPERATITPLRLSPGDRVLLASDGLTDLVGEDRIAHLLATRPDDAAVEALVDAALAAGGKDNVTCLLATVVEGAEGAGSGPAPRSRRPSSSVPPASPPTSSPTGVSVRSRRFTGVVTTRGSQWAHK